MRTRGHSQFHPHIGGIRGPPPQVCTAIVVERMCGVITAVCGVNGSLLVMSYLRALAATGHLAAMLRVEIL